MTIRVFEAFSGVGSQRMALRNLGIDHEVVAISDVDEFTVKSYTAIHDNDKVVSQATDEEMQDYLEKRNIPLNNKGIRKILKGNKLQEFYEACIKSNNLGDISKVETQNIPDHDLFTYSFPCQDISVAGKGLGLNEGSDTRSGLLWECQKVIDGKRPKYLLLENVKNLVGKKHKHNFDKWLEWLEEQGYTNYWQVLNAKDYGVPQNRERVFVVSILGEHEPYEFPEPIELELRLKDVLESEVDEKFYLSKEKSEKLISRFDLKDEPFLLGGEQKNQAIKKDGVSTTLTSSMGTGGGYVPMVNRIGGIFDKDGKTHQAGAVWDKEGLSPTLDTMQGGWRQPSVIVDGGEDSLRFYVKDNVLIDSISLENDFDNTLPFEPDYVYVNPYISEDKDTIVIINEDVDQGERIVRQETIWISEEVIHDVDYLNKLIHEAKPKEEYGRMGKQAVEALNENNVKHSDTINPFNKRVSSTDGISPTLTTRPEGFKTAVLAVVESSDIHDKKDVFIAASRGRNPENPSDRTVGSPTEQRLEINKQGTSNTITTVQKDNYVIEPKDESVIIDDTMGFEKEARVYTDYSPSLRASRSGLKTIEEPQFRIRKLTPKECWRLMGFSDDDFHKAEEVNSNSQLYKQAGNSIVVNVLEGIFRQLFEK